MFAEDSASRDFPSPARRDLSIPPDRLARKIVLDGDSTALPAHYNESILSANVEAIAKSLHAAWLFFTFDTSTHGTWNTDAPFLQQDLKEALEDLRATPDEAMDEGYPQPTQIAMTNAKRILHCMYVLLPTRLEVYPTPDGEIAIVAPSAPCRSVMVLCDSNGGALCMVNMNGVHRRARYSKASSLPDGFLRDALKELAHHAG